jgi:hypothetical protein
LTASVCPSLAAHIRAMLRLSSCVTNIRHEAAALHSGI